MYHRLKSMPLLDANSTDCYHTISLQIGDQLIQVVSYFERFVALQVNDPRPHEAEMALFARFRVISWIVPARAEKATKRKQDAA